MTASRESCDASVEAHAFETPGNLATRASAVESAHARDRAQRANSIQRYFQPRDDRDDHQSLVFISGSCAIQRRTALAHYTAEAKVTKPRTRARRFCSTTARGVHRPLPPSQRPSPEVRVAGVASRVDVEELGASTRACDESNITTASTRTPTRPTLPGKHPCGFV